MTMPRPSPRPAERHSPGLSRAETKERTRQALLDQALALAADRSFSTISLREVAKAAGVVPTAFYRHFASMDDLGVSLVEDSMRVLRKMLRDARREGVTPSGEEAVWIVAKQARAHPQEFSFLVRERHGGSPELQRTFDLELKLFAKDLAQDLSRVPGLTDWDFDDLDMVADIYVTLVFGFAAELLRVDRRNPREEQALIERTRHQLTVLALGLGRYRPSNRGTDG